MIQKLLSHCVYSASTPAWENLLTLKKFDGQHASLVLLAWVIVNVWHLVVYIAAHELWCTSCLLLMYRIIARFDPSCAVACLYINYLNIMSEWAINSLSQKPVCDWPVQIPVDALTKVHYAFKCW